MVNDHMSDTSQCDHLYYYVIYSLHPCTPFWRVAATKVQTVQTSEYHKSLSISNIYVRSTKRQQENLAQSEYLSSILQY